MHIFTAADVNELTVTQAGNLEYLIVAGGGGSRTSTGATGGRGGFGGGGSGRYSPEGELSTPGLPNTGGGGGGGAGTRDGGSGIVIVRYAIPAGTLILVR